MRGRIFFRRTKTVFVTPLFFRVDGYLTFFKESKTNASLRINIANKNISNSDKPLSTAGADHITEAFNFRNYNKIQSVRYE